MFKSVPNIHFDTKRGKYPKFKPPIGVIFCYSKSLIEHIIKNHRTTKVEGFYGEMYLLDETDNKIAVIGKACNVWRSN